MMKKNILLLLALFFSVNVWAQNANIDEIVTNIAQIHCDCAGEAYGFIDADGALIIVETSRAGTKEEVAQILSKLDEVTMKKFIDQSKLFSDTKATEAFGICLNSMRDEVAKLTEEDKKLISKAQLMKSVVNKLGASTNCQLAAVILERASKKKQ